MDLEINSDRPLAIISGASEGIGYELAKEFAKHGYDLIIVSENPAIVETAQICRSLGVNVDCSILSLSKPEFIDEFLKKIIRVDRSIESVVINELIIDDESINSSIYFSKEMARQLVDQKSGRILLLSTINEEEFNRNFSKEYLADLKKNNVTLIAYSIGVIDKNKKNNSSVLAKNAFDALMTGLSEFQQEIIISSMDVKADYVNKNPLL